MDNALAKATTNLHLDGAGEFRNARDPFADAVRRNHRARDVTNELQRATQALRIGQLVKNDTFTLFESVQALEIMDPKMDSGYLAPGETFDEDFDLREGLLPEQVLGIMDQLLRYEVAWHQGYPLSQTLLTSLHLDALLGQKDRPTGTMPLFLPAVVMDQEREAHPMLHLVLRAYCIGVIKSCDIAIEMIISTMYYEEEDFCTQTYGCDLLTDVSDDGCVQLLDEAIIWVGEQLPPDKQQFMKPLIGRLTAKQDFIKAFLPAPNRPTPKYEFERGKQILEIIRSTHQLGMPVPDAFSSKMHRRLASTAPPRPSIELSTDETCEQLDNLYNDLLRILDVVAYDGGAFGLRTFLWSFASRKPQPLTFARAFLQTMTVGQGQIASIEEAAGLIEDDLRVVIFAGQDSLNPAHWAIEHPSDVRFKTARAVDDFWLQAAPEYNKIFQCLCQNRCRIRRSLANVLEDLDILLGSLRATVVAETDLGLLLATRKSFVACIQIQLYQVIAWVLQLGLEQDLMQPHELAASYFVLSRILLTAGGIYDEALDSEECVQGANAGALPDIARMNQTLDLVTDFLSASDELASALFNMYTLLARLRLFPASPPSLPFSTPATQWETRMRPLLSIRHADYIPTYDNFTSNSDEVAAMPVDAVLASATKYLASAKDSFTEMRRDFTEDPNGRRVGAWRSEGEHMAMLRASEKTCVRARLALHVLGTAVARHGEQGVQGRVSVSMPSAEKRDLGWWIVPQLVEL